MAAPTGAEHRRVLGILAGCPDGATARTLELNGVAAQSIYWLEERHLIVGEVQHVAARNSRDPAFHVVRFRITDRGREYLERTR